MDDDLYRALTYTQNDEKTDKRMYVSTINCPKYDPYGAMMATKKQFGKLGGNVAYHGYQSFKTGEVTPMEAHNIGMETARRMWGDDYEIVVTTHLNTDNIHNHIVVNSVSFRTGRKFENHISDHYRLREISDAVCQEYGKSVLKNAKFYGGEKGAYWVRKDGGMTHRDILRRDVDEAISKTTTYNSFTQYLRNLGYEFRRDANGNNPSLIAKGWSRPVRLKSLGAQYTPEAIHDRLIANHSKPELYVIVYPQRKRTPLLAMEYAYREAQRMDGLQLVFAIFIELLKLCTGNSIEEKQNRPLSPMLREEVRKLDKYIEDYMEPFDEYCKHCDGYEYSLKKHGLIQYNDFRGDDHACCRTLIIDPKKFKGDPKEMVEKMYQCEMNGCTADTTGCPFASENSIQQTTTSEGYKYLHPEFHVSMDRGAGFVLDKYGMDGLNEYLTQFTLAFHIPLLKKIQEQGLDAIAAYLRWLYDTEEASDALEMVQTSDKLAVTIHYCPAVKYMKSRDYTPAESYKYCTSMVYTALAQASNLKFEMTGYDHDTGAATYFFAR